MPDNHPADSLIEGIKGLFNGEDIKQSIRDAFDRITGQNAKPTPTPDPYMLRNDPDIASANASFQKKALSDEAAAKIRAKMSKTNGR